MVSVFVVRISLNDCGTSRASLYMILSESRLYFVIKGCSFLSVKINLKEGGGGAQPQSLRSQAVWIKKQAKSSPNEIVFLIFMIELFSENLGK